ncbi:EmrB/QacA subfamily drug resistance transporter [Nocardioides aromaticivorans]|uniref:EmrB/QacA subfamily drug resistance transporter n=1 Tax=Nocardioides aromaticivorans TaxID=200618 RepID=A0A7Z0CMG7_9ACTN|nr:MFS transporter [Nocardioides aromaticivorans]NYI46786.1 EmrB/QacA subfamily drug resistance transporter [Nocardioides aromaticivorans]
MEPTCADVTFGSRTGRAVLAAATLGSAMALLDSTVVNVALRQVGEDLEASLSDLQWVTNGYLLTLAALTLLGGSLGDRFGRRRIFVLGVVGFAVTSAACGLAPSAPFLVVARIAQGAAAALLTPGSLAMIQGSFAPGDRARAIGTWSGFGSVAAAVGPFVGGWLVEAASWRWVFLINLPVAALALLAARAVPETRDPEAVPGFDTRGAVLGALGLGGVTYALIQWTTTPPAAAVALVLGLLAGVAFVVAERRSPHPMLPLSLFGSRQFSAANGMTLLTYAALGGVLFFLVLQLQTVGGYGALRAGLATLPITVAMVLLAGRGGALAARIGPRLPMTVGPLLCGVGTFLLARVDADVDYWLDVAVPLTVFGLGLASLVAPLTAAVLAAAPDHHAGVASGINNAVARAGSLLAVAALPLLVGLSGEDYQVPSEFAHGYRAAMLWCAGLLVVSGVFSWLTIRNPSTVVE